jgi:hypothetical protein
MKTINRFDFKFKKTRIFIHIISQSIFSEVKLFYTDSFLRFIFKLRALILVANS